MVRHQLLAGYPEIQKAKCGLGNDRTVWKISSKQNVVMNFVVACMEKRGEGEWGEIIYSMNVLNKNCIEHMFAFF